MIFFFFSLNLAFIITSAGWPLVPCDLEIMFLQLHCFNSGDERFHYFVDLCSAQDNKIIGDVLVCWLLLVCWFDFMSCYIFSIT